MVDTLILIVPVYSFIFQIKWQQQRTGWFICIYIINQAIDVVLSKS